jgi:hypothetical protein
MLSKGRFDQVQIEPQTDPKIQTATMYILIEEQQLINHHYYTRFMAEETELWCFGCGLGEQAIIEQLGKSFLDYCVDNDPCLGKIMLAMGNNATSGMPYRGDLNVWYTWSDHKGFIPEYLNRAWITPSLLLCASREIEREAQELGLPSIYLPLATGNDFQPLELLRKGLGYAGNPIKPNDQYETLINPFVNRADFEWKSKHGTDKYLSLKELNAWYNTKQVVFGMIAGHCRTLHLIPNRMYETLASGTPFITGRYDLEDTFDFKYPYMTDSREETVTLVDQILADYPRHLKQFAEYSKNVRENHTFDVRIKTLMEHLRWK